MQNRLVARLENLETMNSSLLVKAQKTQIGKITRFSWENGAWKRRLASNMLNSLTVENGEARAGYGKWALPTGSSSH